MDILKIAAIGIIAAILALILRRDAPVFSLFVGLSAGVLILLMVMPKLATVLNMVEEIGTSMGAASEYIAVVLRIIGIAYAAEFGAQICHDAGEGALASKIELAGKLLIMAASAPVITGLIEQIALLTA